MTALLFTGTLLSFPAAAQKSRTSDYRKYAKIIREKIYSTYRDYCREPGGHLPFPFIVPGGAQYGNVLWDWDSWLSDIAIHQAAADQGGKALKEIADYEKGCVLNFLRYSGIDGWCPSISRWTPEPKSPKTSTRKTCTSPVWPSMRPSSYSRTAVTQSGCATSSSDWNTSSVAM